jgi:putative glutamine amidotransferase
LPHFSGKCYDIDSPMPAETAYHPRIGVPYRSASEEKAGKREAYDKYLRAIETAGGEPVEISLSLDASALRRAAESVDAFVLPGSNCDVDPARFHAQPHPKTSADDPLRETTDTTLLEEAFRTGKPVLAICYGMQHLNVFLGGTLVQDIASEIGSSIEHVWHRKIAGTEEPFHAIEITPGSRLEELAAAQTANVNSSHHQSVLEPGRGLRISARAPDGVVEAIEWTGPEWVIGAEWHPERMAGSDVRTQSRANPEDVAGIRLAQRLFEQFIAAARTASLHARTA